MAEGIRRSLGDVGQSYWRQPTCLSERTMGAFRAETGATESWSGMQGRGRGKNTFQIAFPRGSLSLSYPGLASQKWELVSGRSYYICLRLCYAKIM